MNGLNSADNVPFSVIPHSQTIYGSLVETFGPYFQVYTKNQKDEY